MRYAMSALAGACVLCGCAGHIHIHKVSGEGAQAGVPWNLPMTQFKIAITREVIRCGEDPKTKVTATATSQSTIDDSQMYVLDNPGLFSSGKIESELTPFGISSGLTSEVTDETGPALVTVAKIAAMVMTSTYSTQVARTFIPLDEVNFPTPLPQAKPVVEKCTDAVADAVEALYPGNGSSGLQANLDEATTKLNNATATTARLTALNGKSDKQKHALSDAMEASSDAHDEVAALTKELASDKRLTSDTVAIVWPTRGIEFATIQPWSAPDYLAKKWFKDSETWIALAPQLDVWATILYADSRQNCWLPKPPPEPPAEPGVRTSVDGLPVRIAGNGLLVLADRQIDFRCTEMPLGITFEDEDAVAVLEQRILQVGTVYHVPMRGRAFHSETAAIKMDDLGNPTSVHVGQTGAAATAGLDSIGGVLGIAAGLSASRDENDLAKVKTKTDKVKADTDLANARAAAALAKPKAQADAQKALADATLAQMKSEEALDDAKRALSSP